MIHYKTITQTQDDGFTTTDTDYYAYQNNLLIMDSSRGLVSRPAFPYRLITVRHFSNAANSTQMDENLSQYFISDPPPQPCISTYTIAKTYSNGNISSENASSTGCTIGGWNGQFVYDNKINPFHDLEIPFPIMGLTGFNSQKNNLIEEISTSKNLHTRYSYTYRADGYPLIMKATDAFDPTVNWKGIYFYKN